MKFFFVYRFRYVRYLVNWLNVRLVFLLMYRGLYGEMNYLWIDVIKFVGFKFLCNIFNVLGIWFLINYWEVFEEINSWDCYG